MLPKPMIRAILTDSLEATIPIQITDINNKKLANATFIISRMDNPVYLKSNKNGLVFITLNHAILTENPIIKIQYDSFKAKDIRYSIGGKTVVFKDGKSVTSELLEFENIQYIQHGSFKLFYTINKDSAIASLADFLNTLDIIRKITGKAELSHVFPLLISSNNTSVIGEPDGVTILPISLNSWQEKYWHFTHETVENDLISFNNLYEKNSNIRFIGDGLAELISLKVLKSFKNEYANEMLNSRLRSLTKSNSDTFSLYNWSTTSEEIEGYSYSLAFWIKLEKDNSPEIIKEFVRLFSNLKTYRKQDIDQIFETIFGSNISYSMTKNEAIDILSNH
jgi:hypothetical protein